jgi:hypothetical protein
MLAELKRLYEKSGDQITASVIVEAEPRFDPASCRRHAQIETVVPSKIPTHSARDIASLVRAFKDDPDSDYQGVRPATRTHYENSLNRIDREIGNLTIRELKPQDYIDWHARWSAIGKISMANSLAGMVKQVFGHGSTKHHDDDCTRLLGALRAIHLGRRSLAREVSRPNK